MHTRLLAAALLTVSSIAAQRPGPDLDELRRTAFAAIDANAEGLKSLSNRIWRFAETSLKENRSSKALASYLEQQGFAVEHGVAEIPTAFVARYGKGQPVIGILAEFDALPGISNQAVASKRWHRFLYAPEFQLIKGRRNAG